MTWTRTSTCSSQCTTSTPMTTVTQTLAWCTSCAELAHNAQSSTFDDDISHFIGSMSNHFVISVHPSRWALSTSFTSYDPTSWPSASSTTHRFPSPSWSRLWTKTWMTWHSARCSQRHTETSRLLRTIRHVCQSVVVVSKVRWTRATWWREKCRSIIKFRSHTLSEDIHTVRMVDGSGQPEERNGLSSSSSGSSSTLGTSMKQESRSSSSSSAKFRFEKGKMYLSLTSLQCQCLLWLMMDRGNLRKSKPTTSQNQIKRKPRQNGETRVILKSRNGCKNSREIWWMMKFHYRESLTPILLANHLYNRLQRDVRIWVSTVCIFISPKTEIAKSVNGPKLRGPLAEDGRAKPYLERWILVTLITADHKVLSDNCESRNNHRYAIVVQDSATQWIQTYPCKTKTSQENERSLPKHLEPKRNCKEYISNCQKWLRKLYLQHEQHQHERWGQAWHKLHQQVQWHKHRHAQVAQRVSTARRARCFVVTPWCHMHFMAQDVLESSFHPIFMHERLSLTSISSLYASTCPSPSSPSSSTPLSWCTLSRTLTSTTWTPYNTTCAIPRRGVTTPRTSTPHPQVMSPTSWPSASSTTHRVPSPALSRHRTWTWMTWHSARCSQRHIQDKPITANQEACQVVVVCCVRQIRATWWREKCRSFKWFWCHTLSEDIQTVRMVEWSEEPDERNSSNAQIVILLEELHAAHAEDDDRNWNFRVLRFHFFFLPFFLMSDYDDDSATKDLHGTILPTSQVTSPTPWSSSTTRSSTVRFPTRSLISSIPSSTLPHSASCSQKHRDYADHRYPERVSVS